MNKNIRIYTIYRMLFLYFLNDSIITVYLMENNISVTLIYLLHSVSALAGIILEVPTGIFADIHGPKSSLLIASISYVISNCFFIIGKNSIILILASFFGGLCKNFFSGAETSYLYMALQAENRNNEYTKISGNIESVQFILTGVISTTIGYLYSYNSFGPFILAIILGTAASIVLLPAKNYKEIRKRNEQNQYQITLKEGLYTTINNKKILWLMIFTFFMTLMFNSILSGNQIFLQAVNVPVKYFGVIYSLFYLISAIFSKFAYLFQKGGKYQKKLLLFLLSLSVCAGVLALKNSIVIFVIFIPRMIIGIYPRVFQQYINDEITENRNTILSIREAVKNLPIITILPLIGIIIDKKGIGSSYLVISFIGLASTVGLYLLYISQQEKNIDEGEIG
ncbi:hypothetical protein IMSAGC018_01060 [Lachnospiraceae bacterium]|nr:hypothetical protein IMSAGC018_01060 [Lachnospiraceae bacterium]